MDVPFVCRHCNAPFQEAELCRSQGDSHAPECPRFAATQQDPEVERLKIALREAELRLNEQVQLTKEKLRRKDEQICRLTLQLQPELIDTTKTIAVEFEDEGALGLVTDELQSGGTGVYVVGVKPAGQAARIPQVQPGMRIVGVAGRSCANLRYHDVTHMIKTHAARPLVITFAQPEEPASTPPSIRDTRGVEFDTEPEGAPESEPVGDVEATLEPEPEQQPGSTVISEGVPPPSTAPPPVAMLRRLSEDAGRIISNFSEWRGQHRDLTDPTGIPSELISAGFPAWKCRLALDQTAMRSANGEANAALDYLNRYQDKSDHWWRAREQEALSLVCGHGSNWVDVDKSDGT